MQDGGGTGEDFKEAGGRPPPTELSVAGQATMGQGFDNGCYPSLRGAMSERKRLVSRRGRRDRLCGRG